MPDITPDPLGFTSEAPIEGWYTVTGRMIARTAGVCAECEGPIKVGTSIARVERHLDGLYICERCADGH